MNSSQKLQSQQSVLINSQSYPRVMDNTISNMEVPMNSNVFVSPNVNKNKNLFSYVYTNNNPNKKTSSSPSIDKVNSDTRSNDMETLRLKNQQDLQNVLHAENISINNVNNVNNNNIGSKLSINDLSSNKQ